MKKLIKVKPEKRLLVPLKKHAGRDINGHISVRHRGGGVKRQYRLITSLNLKMDTNCKVESIEYDPNRTAFIAKVKFDDGKYGYILAAAKLKVGDMLIASDKTEVKVGNRMQLKNIPTGTQIYDIQLNPDKNIGQLARSAGSFAQVMSSEGKYTQVKLPSGEIRKVLGVCFASVGQVSNPQHFLERISKAGIQRLRGIRPTVRGKAMNPVSHPHGGGEGVAPIGLKYPKTLWGKPARGVKTRRRKYSNKLIVSKRK
ncbi:MAG: 50S ribosomal protein L2 [Candidatus Nealsonbacteria bacterium CG23_combo_of_CG06-09_8_20_14_all_40_13]|uniref:Large ribosomal subunit protein uL2 n=1 Tax=Candidatus Nealsonbacteria bacterium CG23_combo_of_CG06-09_8_20_14_all_40_13 TaxID=1974724 RepID=A0A2G9YR48_9BACT|nr:MAG: 50S ribosomal protein L2 [Candidatus Nealsonbacteria bacterium CG23_combo_of_CG06-09_8_20_14_all_40_13]PIU43444.1 MAG: 50S ribosomal protein L2 [Candidatus Nealsonbacteria bacterium CG07_land_8_20_14_0_80_40_10]